MGGIPGGCHRGTPRQNQGASPEGEASDPETGECGVGFMMIAFY